MDSNTWNSYHIISNRARSICYATRQQQFRMKTEFTVNQLAHQAENHMELMDNLQVRKRFLYGVQVSNAWDSHQAVFVAFIHAVAYRGRIKREMK